MHKSTNQTAAVLDAIQGIYDATANNTNLNNGLGAVEELISIVEDFFSCTRLQSIYLSVLLQLYYQSEVTNVNALLDHLGKKQSTAIEINREFAVFVSRGWLIPSVNPIHTPNVSYELQEHFLNGIHMGKISRMRPQKIKSSFDLLRLFQDKLNKLNKGLIDQKVLSRWAHKQINKYKSISIAEFIIKHKINDSDLLCYMYICLDYYKGERSIDVIHMLNNLKFNPDEKYFIQQSYDTRMNYLIREELVCIIESDNLFASSEYRLSPNAIKSFDPDYTCKIKNEKLSLSKISAKGIIAKQLYYQQEEQLLVDKLHHMLQGDVFISIAERFTSKGMTPGVTILLYGGPGTGKTELCYQLARQTGRDILAADPSRIRSKWYGETDKNIKRLFEDYKKACISYDQVPILLMNECDSILGVRVEAGRAIADTENTMQNILLEELEKFEGILIATTNLTNNLDKAFDRRFLYKIKLESPKGEVLQKIWMEKFPELNISDIVKICDGYQLSGAQIENIRKKATMDTLLCTDIRIDYNYIRHLVEQELILQTELTRRNVIGFNVSA